MARKPTGVSEPDFYDFLETAWSLSDSQLSRAISFLNGRSRNLRLLHPAAERRQVDVVLLAELTLALPGLQKLLDLLHLELRGVRLVLLLTHGT